MVGWNNRVICCILQSLWLPQPWQKMCVLHWHALFWHLAPSSVRINGRKNQKCLLLQWITGCKNRWKIVSKRTCKFWYVEMAANQITYVLACCLAMKAAGDRIGSCLILGFFWAEPGKSAIALFCSIFCPHPPQKKKKKRPKYNNAVKQIHWFLQRQMDDSLSIVQTSEFFDTVAFWSGHSWLLVLREESEI